MKRWIYYYISTEHKDLFLWFYIHEINEVEKCKFMQHLCNSNIVQYNTVYWSSCILKRSLQSITTANINNNDKDIPLCTTKDKKHHGFRTAITHSYGVLKDNQDTALGSKSCTICFLVCSCYKECWFSFMLQMHGYSQK